VSQQRPPRDAQRRLEVELMFAELVVEDVSRSVVGAQHFDDQYSGHARYFPPWLVHVDGVPTQKGPRTAATWAQAWLDWELRPFWNPPDRAAVAEALDDRQAAITELASRLLPLLTPVEREVYRLHYVAGMSINKIARLRACHRGSVTARLGAVKAKAKAIAGGNR
jgi:hypothetical protein